MLMLIFAGLLKGVPMKAFLALGLVAAFSNPAFAEVPCDGGKLDIFKFVKWDFKPAEFRQGMEIT